MNRFLLIQVIFIVLICIEPVKAQYKFGAEWYLGQRNIKIQFTSPSPQWSYLNNLDSMPKIVTGHSNICDSNGKLILATDGIKLYDGNGGYLAGGGEQINNDSLAWGEGNDMGYRNTSIILPKGKNQYYIFTTTASDIKYMQFYNLGDTMDFNQLRVTTVDMNENSGHGKIISKNKLVYETEGYPWLNKSNMTACRHGNGRDWWLLKPSARHREIMHRFLVSADTIVHEEQNLSIQFQDWCYDNGGQSCFSQDGSLYAECNGRSPLTIYYFDRCSGELTLKRVFDAKPYKDTFGGWFNQNEWWQGLSFSPNKRFLYIADRFNVYQIDLENTADAQAIRRVSKDSTLDPTILNPYFFPEYSTMRITPTGVLCLGNRHGVSQHLNAILEPDRLGDACNFKFSYLSTQGNLNNISDLPNLPNYGLGALKGSHCDSLSPPIASDLPLLILPNAFSPNGDGLNDVWRILNVSKLQAENVQFQEVGIYNRLGNCVFKSNVRNFEWDAKSWASGTYFYYIRYKTANGVSEVMKGDVMVVR